MKIVCVGYLHGAGGAERQIIMLANALAENKDNQVSLIVLANNNSIYGISSFVNIIDLSKCENHNKPNILKRFLSYRKTIIELCPDITIHYWVQSVYFSLGISKEKKGKTIYSERGDPSDAEYTGILKILRDFSFKYVDGFVFQSEGARNYFDTTIQKKSVVIHNPVSVPKDTYVIPDIRKKVIISVGRLHHQKNQNLLIDSFFMISKKFPDYSLEIYGEGELQDELDDKIANYSLKERIHILSPTKDIFSKIVESSLFVLTSDFEGMPNALMEAMALGVPCISTDCKPGGARALINNNENGIIVPLNDVESLASAIEYLISNPIKAKELSNRALDILNTHSPEVIYQKWYDFLNGFK